MGKRNRTMLDRLEDNSHTSAETSDPSGRVFLDVQNRTGADHAFVQYGASAFIRTGSKPLVLVPGLNIIERERWEAYADHPPVAAMIDDGRASVVDLDALGHVQIKALAERTVSADALLELQRREHSKPAVGGRGKRRDGELLDMLDRKVRVAERHAPPNLDAAVSAAQQTARLMAG
jgi:hypothetical protein